MKRLANFEFLRIIAMAMIIILHCNYWSIGLVTKEHIETSEASAFLRIFIQQACIVSSNVFVMISGWFGLKPQLLGGVNFVYQVFFHSIVILIFNWIIGAPIPHSSYVQLLSLGCWIWFVPCYLGLYILSPILNSYVENTSSLKLGRFVLVFMTFETLYGWVFSPSFFNSGYSIIHFIGLYLMMRYVRNNEHIIAKYNTLVYILLYLSFSVIPTIIVFIGIKNGVDALASFMTAYSSPIVIAGSLFFFLSFYSLKIKRAEAVINYGASSMFAVLLLHLHPAIAPYFKSFMKHCYAESDVLTYYLKAIGVAVLIIIVGILVDQPRKLTWKIIYRNISHRCFSKV